MRPYYDQDGITIYHADCADILPSIDYADMLLTDPPYGGELDTDFQRFSGTPEFNAKKGYHRGNTYPLVAGDDRPFDPRPLLGLADKVILWGAEHYADLLPPSRLRSRGWLVWDKREELGSNMLADAELAWTSFATPTRIFRHKWLGYMRASEVGYHVHPTQKPVSLMRWILEQWTTPGDLILDPYMGSGPIAQACYDLGRRYVGVEIVEKYCEIAVTRLSQGVLNFGEA